MTSMWRTSGWILVGSALILALSLGVRHGFGLFLAPMSAEFGWGREVFAFAIALQNLIWGLTQPFTGALADRFGARRTVLVGGVLYAIGLACMGGDSLLHGEGREAHEFGKGPVLMDAERPVSGIEVPLPRHGQPRGDGVVVRRHAHALTHFIPADTRAHPIDGSGHFVPDDQRRFGRSEGMPVLQHPDVGSTHAGAASAQHQFPRSGLGYWQVLDAQVVGAVKAGGFHAPQSYTTERLVTNDRCRRIIILRRRGEYRMPDDGCRMTT